LQGVFEFLVVCGWLICGQSVVKRLANAVCGRTVFGRRKLCSFWGFILGEDEERATTKANTGILRFAQNDDAKQKLQLQLHGDCDRNATATATATIEADPCGMTNKGTGNRKGRGNGKGEIQGSLHCATDGDAVRCFGRDDVFLVLG
jgi:hypothetical protein